MSVFVFINSCVLLIVDIINIYELNNLYHCFSSYFDDSKFILEFAIFLNNFFSVNQFELFRPLIGNESIQYANQARGKKLRQINDRHYSFSAIEGYFQDFKQVLINFSLI